MAGLGVTGQGTAVARLTCSFDVQIRKAGYQDWGNWSQGDWAGVHNEADLRVLICRKERQGLRFGGGWSQGDRICNGQAGLHGATGCMEAQELELWANSIRHADLLWQV